MAKKKTKKKVSKKKVTRKAKIIPESMPVAVPLETTPVEESSAAE